MEVKALRTEQDEVARVLETMDTGLRCCQCQGKDISPKDFLHFPTMTWWQREVPADAPAEVLRLNHNEVGQTQFVFCGRDECLNDWMETRICRRCGPNATEPTRKGKGKGTAETFPDPAQLMDRTEDIAIVAHYNGKESKKSFEEMELRRRERERNGLNKEELCVEAALERIRADDAPVREFLAPRCATCKGKVAPRRCEPLQAVPDPTSMDSGTWSSRNTAAGSSQDEALVAQLEGARRYNQSVQLRGHPDEV